MLLSSSVCWRPIRLSCIQLYRPSTLQWAVNVNLIHFLTENTNHCLIRHCTHTASYRIRRQWSVPPFTSIHYMDQRWFSLCGSICLKWQCCLKWRAVTVPLLSHTDPWQSKEIIGKQLPLMAACAFTDHRSQGQTVQNRAGDQYGVAH